MISALYLHESHAAPKPLGLIKAKAAVVKAKVALAKIPKLIAGTVAKKIAAAKAAAALAAVSNAID